MNESLDTLKSLFSGIDRLVKGIETLAIPRVEDLPYWNSPPIQFVYESETPLSLGTYQWNDRPMPLTPNRPILDNALYFFRNITLSADISQLDYEAAILTTPQFNAYLSGDSKTILFREPITVNRYLDQFDYRMFWMPRRGGETLLGGFRGELIQIPALIGKVNITLKAVISAQEIVNEDYIDLFTHKSYPGNILKNTQSGRGK
jgi:hypothetical protein